MIKQGFLRDQKKDAGKVTARQLGLLHEALHTTLYMCDSFYTSPNQTLCQILFQ
jgi:hypothetical protein